MAVYTPSAATSDIEDGEYGATIDFVEYRVADPTIPSRYEQKNQYIISWKLDGFEEETIKFQYVNDPAQLTANSALYALFSAVLNGGNALDEDGEYDTAQLVGKRARIVWAPYTGEDKDGKPMTKHKIKQVLAPKRQQAKAQPRTPVQEPIDPDAALNDI